MYLSRSPNCPINCWYTSHLDHHLVSLYDFGALLVRSFHNGFALQLLRNILIHRLPNSFRVGISKWFPTLSKVWEKHTTFNMFGNMKDTMFRAAWSTLAPSRIAASNEFPLTPYSTDRHWFRTCTSKLALTDSKVASHPKCDHFGEKYILRWQDRPYSYLCFKKEISKKYCFYGKLWTKECFLHVIADNGMLTTHCNNLSTHHYYLTYHPCFDTQFSRCCHVFKKKAKAIEVPFCAKESGKKKKRIGLTKLLLAPKGLITRSASPRKLCRAVAWRWFCGFIHRCWSCRPESNLYC